MSLLMKALEKAAQDREKAPEKSAAATMASAETTRAPAETLSGALMLEPITSTASSTSSASATASDTAELPVSTSSTHRDSAQARAATVLSAQSTGSGSAATWISTHPVHLTAALAGIVGVGYGIYLYLQIAHPALFIRQAPQPVAAAKPAPATPITPITPAPPPPAAAADASLIPAQSVFSSAPATKPPEPASAAAVAAVAPKPAPTQPLGQITAPAAAVTPPTAAATVAKVTPATPNRITISRGDTTVPRVNPLVSEAYAALESGRLEAAQHLYGEALRGEPNNIDALLGLAAIARYENRIEDASRHYLRVLDTDPRNALAQTGLIALAGRADPQAAETRLKQLAARDPSPTLYFTLGNLYADQGQWAQAQQAYFQAHHLEPGNPDYAYNLAVALEHLGQQKLALGFYRRALQLAAGKGRANFNAPLAQARITQLAARLE